MNSSSRNWISVLSAVFFALTQIFWLSEVFQWAMVQIAGAENAEFSFKFVLLNFYFEPDPITSFPVILFLYLSPVVYLIFCTETASFFLRKTPVGIYRYFLIVFTLIILGYLILHLFYNAVILILNPDLTNDWITLSIYLGFGETERIVFAFGTIFLFVFYLNLLLRRITSYIN